ncbi:MAG: 4-hydroxythreonine-4-phosphate dehydrogenase PdxA [Candidatus Margulisbacteria bacterium]|nr:4-hydroxythreonine-4-phosphate dehydrogenase PdxA [Candidatus Margulisiibacteriota bacterium]MBU1022385.1 4-hydroxythreonine-4-phosphate dehydrogenase PdxA [Candidatus Margulisiibacteriota bacterium]MBU1729063.1 4-hydroxythreonine-4-phosphate dehydrogenase PdxA [Candidatus Margulisiibacteriota bacterium]MBU1954516.1 4-hydroxythreonine-4-phosphate dehydrogenase PdxA [Candidatus Margulisiibacteriota bacterium]
MSKKPTIGITMGDPAGIGPEVCVKALSSSEVNKIANPVIIGDAKTIEEACRILKNKSKINTISKIEDAVYKNWIINVLDLNNVPASLKKGQVSKAAGKAAVEYVFKAIELAKNKKIDAITTAPINKEAMHKAGFKYQGHTEILARETKTKNYGMLFVSPAFWVMLVTTHLPLHSVSKALSKDKIFEKIKLAHDFLQKVKKQKPKIGVAGLNPHAGESGIFGKEEIKIIKPAIEKAKKQGIKVEGPISPDAIFNLAKANLFDIVIAMYHDQGLIPLKLAAFNKSVNVTAGLPFVRTSVDHGTGFDIAWRGYANPSSLIEAIKAAALFCK